MSFKIPFDQGSNTSKDVSDHDTGELLESTGGFYRPGDRRIHKIGGVSTFGDTGSGKRVDGVVLLRFDEGGTDKVVALSDKVLYGANVIDTGATGTFSSLKSGLGTLATSLSAAQYNDKHYLAVGSENLVVKSDGTTHAMSLKAPRGEVTGTTGTGTILIRADSSTSTFTNAAQAYDSDTDTYSSAVLSGAGTTTERFSWTGTSNTGSNRILEVKYALSGFPVLPDQPSDGDFDDVGGTFDAGFSVKIRFEISEDGGSTFTEVFNQTRTAATGTNYAQFDITDSLEIQDNLVLKVTFTYVTGDTDASLFLYDMNVNDGGTASTFSLTTGVYYAVSEYDENERVEGPALYSKLVTGSTFNRITLTLPTSANSRATHWRIYRTTDGGSLPSTLGLIGQKPISATTHIDTFPKYDKDTQALPFYPLLRVRTQQDKTAVAPLYFPQNSPARRFAKLRVYQGSLVGLSSENPRALWYSMAGKPESWPEINVIDTFPFEEHDELVDCISLGLILVIAAKGLMMRMVDLPRVINASQDRSRVEPIKGAPGCVGRYALTAYSVSGEPRAAWISPYGVWVTNGDSVERISDDIDWEQFDTIDKSGWTLHWDRNRLCLVMGYSTSNGGGNDRYALIHLSPEHIKPNRQPKWTLPHYGSFDSYTSGQVASNHRVYVGHASDGIVYVMDNRGTGADSSKAYSGTTLPMILKTGRTYAKDRDWAVLDARLFHSDFGTGQTCKVEWTMDSDDDPNSKGVRTEPALSLSENKGSQFDVSMRGQWAQIVITHTGTGRGSIRDLEMEVVDRGRVGSKKIA